jgi:hypothetical protein
VTAVEEVEDPHLGLTEACSSGLYHRPLTRERHSAVGE